LAISELPRLEDNSRSGMVLAMCYRLQQSNHLQALDYDREMSTLRVLQWSIARFTFCLYCERAQLHLIHTHSAVKMISCVVLHVYMYLV